MLSSTIFSWKGGGVLTTGFFSTTLAPACLKGLFLRYVGGLVAAAESIFLFADWSALWLFWSILLLTGGGNDEFSPIL